MKIIVELLFLALGYAMLVKGADWFVEGSSGIADRFHFSPVSGLTRWWQSAQHCCSF